MDEDTPTTLQFTSAELAEHLTCPVCCRWLSSAFNTSCGHLLCGTCTIKWLQHSSTCPVCRTVQEAAPSRCFPLEAFLHERLLPQLGKDAAPSCSGSPAELAKAVALAFERRRRSPEPRLELGPVHLVQTSMYDGVRAPASLYDGSWGSSDDEEEDGRFGGTVGSPHASPRTQQASASTIHAVAGVQHQQQPQQQLQQHSQQQQHTAAHQQQQQQLPTPSGTFRMVTVMESPTVQHWQLQPVRQQAPAPPMPQLTMRTTARDYYHNPPVGGLRIMHARHHGNDDTRMERDQ